MLHFRRRITDTEAAFFMKQIVTGVQYLHSLKIIHRDLKPGNIFLSEDMNIKIGDFGLSVMHEPTKYCGRMGGHKAGTPNYISPEILSNHGYYYETDIWAIGIILYAMLVGKPPFQKKTKETTHEAIKSGVFTCPSTLSSFAKKVIKDILKIEPKDRPSLSEIVNYDFFVKCDIPQTMTKEALFVKTT